MPILLSPEPTLTELEVRLVLRALRNIEQSAGLLDREVPLTVVDDDEMRELNRTWRGKDMTTDVLSFPAGEAPKGVPAFPLGDLVISAPVARRQATSAGHGLEAEFAALAVHGLLHLLGFDHERGHHDAVEMAEHELTLLVGAGFDAGVALVGRGF